MSTSRGRGAVPSSWPSSMASTEWYHPWAAMAKYGMYRLKCAKNRTQPLRTAGRSSKLGQTTPTGATRQRAGQTTQPGSTNTAHTCGCWLAPGRTGGGGSPDLCRSAVAPHRAGSSPAAALMSLPMTWAPWMAPVYTNPAIDGRAHSRERMSTPSTPKATHIHTCTATQPHSHNATMPHAHSAAHIAAHTTHNRQRPLLSNSPLGFRQVNGLQRVA